MRTVYISSTYVDLKECRESTYRILRSLGYDAIAMEDYVAADQRPLDRCLKDVGRCDVYVGIFAGRYGYIPEVGNPEQKSVTELEYREAARLGKPCLIFLLDPAAKWQTNLLDSETGAGDHGRRIAALRQELAREKLVSFFRSRDHLASLVSVAVQREVPPITSSGPPGASVRDGKGHSGPETGDGPSSVAVGQVSESALPAPKVRRGAYKIKALEERRAVLEQQFQAANRQLILTLNEVDKVPLKAQLEDLDRKLTEVDAELDRLQSV